MVERASSRDFNPELMTLAREARGLTQTELAGAMGVTQPTVSKIEAAVMEPSKEDLRRLADVLDFPDHFFTQRRRIYGPGLVEMFHRKKQRAGVKVLNRIHARAAIQLMNIEDLFRSGDEHEDNIPIFPIDQFDDNPEKIARTVRALLQFPSGPVFDVTRAIEDAGGVVIRTDFKTNNIDGFSKRTGLLPPIFFISSASSPDRWRWTLAHELAHMVMHVDPDATARYDREIEDQANRFAGEFLAPAHEIKPHLWSLTLPRLANLKRYWKISMQALIMRAFHLNAINAKQRTDLFKAISRAGYRLHEPQELDPPTEYPESVGRLLAYHRKQLEYSDLDLMNGLRIGIGDLLTLESAGTPTLRAM
jgi:Zn-dependent peptidase ImmA (M78 family)/DNA-binding XRE family transcriptional regulator